MQINFSTDFEQVCTDFHKPATIRIAGVDHAVSKVNIVPYQIRELDPTQGQVVRNGTLFIWAKSRTDEPPIGSIVIDNASTYWTVWRLINAHHVETWQAFCLNLNIVTAAANTATILAGTYGKGASNEARAIWSGLWSGVEGGTAEDTVTARFQPSEETSRIEFSSEWSRQAYRVYFESPVPIQATGGNYRLVDSDGYRYNVIRFYQENLIDRLPVAIAVRITEGAEYFGAGSSSA